MLDKNLRMERGCQGRFEVRQLDACKRYTDESVVTRFDLTRLSVNGQMGEVTTV